MRLRLLAWLTLAAVLPTQGVSEAGPHPTILTVKYRDAMRPVVAMNGNDPVVLVDGKEKRIRTEPVYEPVRVGDYSAAEVELREILVAGLQLIETTTGVIDPWEGNHAGLAELTFTAVARQPLARSFVAVVIYSPAAHAAGDASRPTQIIVHALPALPAGIAVPVRISSRMYSFTRDRRVFLQLFDQDGAEIFTPYAKVGWSYYAGVERFRLTAVLNRYLEAQAGKDAQARPVVTIKPRLPKGVPPPEEPVTVDLRITAEGLVEGVDLPRSLDGEARSVVESAMAGWLFLPRLKSGQAVPCVVRVPLRF
jgi:hypothetical protein